MKIVNGDLYTFPANYRCVTTNGIVRENGCLVMGKGCALDAKQKYPNIDKKLGDFVTKYGNRVFLCLPEKIISFPTKEHWKDKSSVALIIKSAGQLVDLCNKFHLDNIVLPAPGCGNGQLRWSNIKPILEDILDDRFTVVIPIYDLKGNIYGLS